MGASISMAPFSVSIRLPATLKYYIILQLQMEDTCTASSRKVSTENSMAPLLRVERIIAGLFFLSMYPRAPISAYMTLMCGTMKLSNTHRRETEFFPTEVLPRQMASFTE